MIDSFGGDRRVFHENNGGFPMYFKGAQRFKGNLIRQKRDIIRIS